MEDQLKPVTTTSTAIRYGLIVGLVCIVYSFILAMADLNMHRGLTSVSYLFILGGMVLAFKYFKQHNGGFMSYGQGLGIGTLMSLVAGVLASIFMFIYTKFIDTELLSRAMEMQRVEMEKRGMEDAQIDQAMEMAAKFTSPIMVFVFGVIGFAIVGFIFALIVSAIMKETRPEFE